MEHNLSDSELHKVNKIVLPIDLSILDMPKLLIALEEQINNIWECKYEPDKFFLVKGRIQKIIKELKKRKGN